jgi:hypothetical protein
VFATSWFNNKVYPQVTICLMYRVVPHSLQGVLDSAVCPVQRDGGEDLLLYIRKEQRHRSGLTSRRSPASSGGFPVAARKDVLQTTVAHGNHVLGNGVLELLEDSFWIVLNDKVVRIHKHNRGGGVLRVISSWVCTSSSGARPAGIKPLPTGTGFRSSFPGCGNTVAARQRRPSRAVPHHTQSSPHTVDRVWSWRSPHNPYVLCNTPNCQNYTDVRCETRPGGPLTPQILSLFLRRPLCGWLSSLSGGLSALCPLRCQSLVGGRPVTHYGTGSKLLPVVATVDPRLSDSGPGTIKLRYNTVLPSLKSLYYTTLTTLLYASGAFAAASGVCAVAQRHSAEVHVRVHM